MITGVGKDIISRYLLGHTSSYATHIGIGCGVPPYLGFRWFFTSFNVVGTLATVTAVGHQFKSDQTVKLVQYSPDTPSIAGEYMITVTGPDTFTFFSNLGDTPETTVSGTATQIVGDIYSDSPSMLFETRRLPILSRGYVNDNPTRLVFTAELPSDTRQVITEASLWTAQDDPNVLGSPSRMLFTMDPVEGWIAHSPDGLFEVPKVAAISDGTLDIDVAATGPIFATDSNNVVFDSLPRARLYEGGRVGNTVIGLRGNSSTILPAGSHGVVSAGSSHIHVATQSMDFSRNNTTDELRVAFWVSTSSAASLSVAPEKARVMVEFLYSETAGSPAARMYIEVDGKNLVNDKYVVATSPLHALSYSPDFSWTDVRVVRISAHCTDAVSPPGLLSEDFFVFLDGIRFENLSSNNPLYGMTAYSIVRDNSVSVPAAIVSSVGEPGYVEFRLNLEVL